MQVSKPLSNIHTEEELEAEANRLYGKLKSLNWGWEECALIAPQTLAINELKQQKNAIILAHSYQKPQIIFGVADFVGDSYGLSKEAMKTEADIIVFAGVRFMAETAKLLNPNKTVLLPSLEAGCSLAEGIQPQDVRRLKEQYPGVPVLGYVNTTAEVKAECDVCFTSANALQIINSLETDQDTIIVIPDKYMAKNLEESTGKRIIGWDAECIVHNQFTSEQIEFLREQYPDIQVLAHSECDPSVALQADLVGGTGDMIRFVKSTEYRNYALITECGLSERLRVEFPEKNFVGSCVMCPYMKTVFLERIFNVLHLPSPSHIIEIPDKVRHRARQSLDRMFELSR
ncbi:MAG: quinolinate synthase NadA [Candidatus Thorarchaeota archaeon]